MDSKKLEKYITLYHNAVYRLAYSYVKNSFDADDICQEAFLRLYKSDEVFASDENCKAWLMKVAVNLSKNMLKSAWFTKRDDLDENIPADEKADYMLLEKVKKLPPRYASIIHLYYFEGYDANEISHITGIPVSTVTTRLSRGRDKLRKIFEKEDLL